MPTQEEIIRGRALQDLSDAIQARDARKAAILAERPARLDAIPSVHAALAAHDDAAGAAGAAFDEALDDIRRVEQEAKIVAFTKEGDDGKEASQTAEDEKSAAEFARRDQVDEANRVHAEAFRAASRLLGVEADTARKAANDERERSIAAANRTLEEAKARAFAKMNTAFETAKDVLDAAVRAAESTAATSVVRAEEQRTKAVRAADAALSAALAADPRARAVEEDTQRRLRLEDERSDAERAAIMERMARELEALPRGGLS